MKTWHIKTWGAGTPHYLVSAETKEEAWKMVEKEWWKEFTSYYVGEKPYGQEVKGKWHQTIDDLEEIVGLTTGTKMIFDLDED